MKIASTFIVFALLMRIFVPQELCSHPQVQIQPENHHACHKENRSIPELLKKSNQIPCDHMKDCLLDSGDHEPFLQKSGYSAETTNVTVYAFCHTALSPVSLPASYDACHFYPSPPELQYLSTPDFLSKASLLI